MKKKQHLIALDLDGTLLTDNKEISQHNMQVINQLITNGHIVVIATGRSNHASIHYYNMLKLTTPIVNFNGALTYHPKNKNWGVFHHPIPLQTALQVINTCHELDVYNILAEQQDHIYLDRPDQEIIDAFKTGQDTDKDLPFIVGTINNNLTDSPTSLLIKPKENHMNKLSNYLEKNHNRQIEHRNWGAPWNIFEITKKGIHKAYGLKKIVDYYQIPRERVIAFGDEDNDLEMIDYAGVGVAMNNAIPELKKIANYITDTNEEDGVSTFLENYLDIQLPIH